MRKLIMVTPREHSQNPSLPATGLAPGWLLTSVRFIARMAAGTSILLAISATLLSAACVSGGRLSATILQSPRPPAGVITGSWDKVVVLPPGSRVIVTLIDGERLEGAYRTVSPEDLTLTDSAGRDVGVARSNIRQIVARGERDDLVNGALLGAGVGLATAAAILAAAASGDGYILASAKWGAPLLLSAVGGVIGIFVDRSPRDDEVVYVRP